VPDAAAHVLPPYTYVAGLFNSGGGDGPKSALVPAANWLQIRVTVRAGSAVSLRPSAGNRTEFPSASGYARCIWFRAACAKSDSSSLKSVSIVERST
jgi:hypothetical protein